ncbi:MAG: hypothetical protein MI749_14320, partial [Desulfovibrionales bacterium]|nr:hypothetical protein [Desulfovibrionales bacterium]
QSAFGDLYAWFRDLLLWPVKEILDPGGDEFQKTADAILPALSRAAEAIEPGSSAPLALDWMNGRRTPDADQGLKGAITHLTLGSSAPAIFRSLVEATAFGSRAIAQRFQDEGIPINGVIAVGGVAKKSPLVMQIVADVMDMEIRVAASEQTCALGSAMLAAVAGGIHPHVDAAQTAMGKGFETTYTPNPERVALYDELYGRYLRLGSFMAGEK